jgi:hypothetical protein
VSGSETHPSSIHVEKNGFIADIVVSKNGSGDIFHYVIQKVGSPEIVHWGQELSFHRAMECVEEFFGSHQVKQA